MIADYSPPPPMKTERLYYLRPGKFHAPISSSASIPACVMPQTAEYGEFHILDMKVRIEPNGARWGDQQGRTVSYIVNWFNRHERRFPNDADRFWYVWGWDAS